MVHVDQKQDLKALKIRMLYPMRGTCLRKSEIKFLKVICLKNIGLIADLVPHPDGKFTFTWNSYLMPKCRHEWV